MNHSAKQLLKKIPSVQLLLSHPAFKSKNIKFEYLKLLIQRSVDNLRNNIQTGKLVELPTKEKCTDKIIEDICKQIEQLSSVNLKRVINGTGIILHTNLGRAPFAASALNHMKRITENYCNLEIDLLTGKRGNRISIIEDIICLITSAESAVMVNNNAAAVLLTLNSLTKNKEVPVSRGELVEIGGSFRMPDVMKASGAKMVEIGTTNRTHFEDYENALSDKSGAILKVHTSNYKLLGFTKSVPIQQLVFLATQRGIPLIYDMGSGVIEGLENWGYSHEPIAREFIAAGVDVLTFSGDKVLGGPQAGFIIGKNKYIQKIKKSHLLRALRCDKMTYALMEETLRLYLKPELLPETLPVAKMLTLPIEELKRHAKFIKNELKNLPFDIEIVACDSQMGSGALPLEKIPSVAIQVVPRNLSVTQLAKRLRLNDPAILGYIEKDHFYLDLRTVRQDELNAIINAFTRILF